MTTSSAPQALEYAYVLSDMTITMAGQYYTTPPRLSFPGWCPVARLGGENPDPEIYTESPSTIMTDDHVLTISTQYVHKPVTETRDVLMKRIADRVQEIYAEYHIGEPLYTIKVQQATDYIKNQSGSPSLLEAGVGIDGVTIIDVAYMVSANANLAEAVMAIIEKARLRAKQAIRAATSTQEALDAWGAFQNTNFEEGLGSYIEERVRVYASEGSLRRIMG